MKKPINHNNIFQALRYSLSSFLFPLSSLLLTSSCSNAGGAFRMEGEFKGFNQGELYVYSPDGGLRKLDTISVKGGRFTYEVRLDSTATFVLVFPNYSEVPVIGESGATVEVKGDASHLKEIEVHGTKANDQMTGFRLKTSEMPPPEVVREASAFIKDHPASLTSVYLLRRYFLLTPTPDYRQAHILAETIRQAQPYNKQVAMLVRHLKGLERVTGNGALPKFSAIDIKGHPISNGDLYAPVNVITTWSSWNFESQNIQRQLKSLEREKGVSRLRIMSICLDADARECRRLMDRDSIMWSNICDERMWDNPIITSLGLSRVPDNIISDAKGHIIAHSLPVNELKKKIEELLQ